MAQPPPPDPARPPAPRDRPPRAAPADLEARRAREAAALRANLRKRKDQTRARQAPAAQPD